MIQSENNLTKTLLIINKLNSIEQALKNNTEISNLSELLFCVADIKAIAINQLQVFILAEEICGLDYSSFKDTQFKYKLYSNLNRLANTKSKTRKEHKKVILGLLINAVKNFEKEVKSNQSVKNSFEFLNSIAELKCLAKAHSEVLRLSFVVCFFGVFFSV